MEPVIERPAIPTDLNGFRALLANICQEFGSRINAFIRRDGVESHGDEAATLIPGRSPRTHLWGATLTADRAVSLDTVAAAAGDKFRIVRTADGGFALNVGPGPLKALNEDEWCDVEYDGENWILTAFGSL